jgi:hypothetical protein
VRYLVAERELPLVGGSLDIGSIIGQIASGGVGGGVLMVIVGLIKQALGKTT